MKLNKNCSLLFAINRIVTQIPYKDRIAFRDKTEKKIPDEGIVIGMKERAERLKEIVQIAETYNVTVELV